METWYTVPTMETNVLTFRTIIVKDGKYYHGFVPSLPGCHTQGETIDDTRKNLKEAIEGVLLVMKKYKQQIPIDEGLEGIETIDLSKLSSRAPSYA